MTTPAPAAGPAPAPGWTDTACVICRKGPRAGVSIHRINALGVRGLWACDDHLAQTDAPPRRRPWRS
jgi:hypothetical protein